MIQVSVYKNTFSKEFADSKAVSIIKGIREGHWKDRILNLRSLSEDEYKKQKVNLPAVTFSGTFHERLATKLNKYSNLLILDIDNLEQDNITRLKNLFPEDPFIHFAFVSPSNKGVKIVIKVSSGPEHHLAAFLHAQKVFEEKYCLKVDNSGKDICRLCFVSYDPDSYYNENSQVFEVDTRYGEVNKYTTPEGLQNVKATQDTQKILLLCISWVEKKFQYAPGGRNSYIHALACALNRCGVSKDAAEEMLISKYDLGQEEIKACVKHAYFHNMHEHGSVEVKDIGLKEFSAPAYAQNYDNDPVINDIKQITALLHFHKVPNKEIYDIVKKIGVYYHHKGFIDLKAQSLGKIMNEALTALNKKESENLDKTALSYMSAENIIEDIIGINFSENAIATSFTRYDEAMLGGLMPGNFYGIIGVGGTYKSVLAQFLAFVSALSGKAALYLNGEMTKKQFYERFALLSINANFNELTSSGKLTKETMPQIIKEMNDVVDNNLKFVQGSGFNEENILATIEKIKVSEGKKIKLVVVDGITEMDWGGLQEIPAAINNSSVCKEIAKNAHGGEGVVVIALYHISGQPNKLIRDSGPLCRGGVKTTARMDGYFSTSLLASEENNSIEHQGDDIIYVEDKFFLKYVDKRGSGGFTNAIIKVNSDLRLQVESYDTNPYEIKINK